MPIHRRDFLKYTSAAAAAAAGLPLALTHAKELITPEQQPDKSLHESRIVIDTHPELPPMHTQRMHPDFQSNNDGVEYFFLGNGSITAALQTSQAAEGGTNCGLLVMSPEHFGRKAGTFLYHPEHGLRKSLFSVVVDGTGHAPSAAPEADRLAKEAAEKAEKEGTKDSARAAVPGIFSGGAGPVVPKNALPDSAMAMPEQAEEDDEEEEERPGSPIEPFYSRVWDVKWIYPDSIPTVAMEWRAGACAVHEELFCPAAEPALIRTVTITNDSNADAAVSAFIPLAPNPMFFDEERAERKTLMAKGFAELRLFSPDAARAADRQLQFEFGTIAPGESKTVTVVLTLDQTREAFEKKSIAALKKEAGAYWSAAVSLNTNDESYNHLFRVSQSSLRAAAARSGKMDGGIWEHHLERVRDQSMAAAAASMMGRADLAESLLRRALGRFVDGQGGTVDASRALTPETMELDQNGELLYALWVHWMWTGNESVIRKNWESVRRVADYVLRPEFRDPSTGLLKNAREFWGRDASYGVKEGYELAYQVWNIVGLSKAAEMGEMMNDRARARAWREASDLMKKSFLSHPKFSFVHEGRFIKRRTADGGVQSTFEPKDRTSMPPGMPMNVEKVSYCDPDSANLLPIMFDFVDARGSVAANTLHSMNTLRNQRWRTGGYGRFDVTSESDSPGAWPIAAAWVARAALEAGDDPTVMRALGWLRTVQGGSAGAWLEFYGDRPVPPLPPVGITVGTWSEIVMFFMHGMVGVRPERTECVIRPRLVWGLDVIDARIPVRGMTVDLKVRRGGKEQYALVNGKRLPLADGALRLPYVKGPCAVEIYV